MPAETPRRSGAPARPPVYAPSGMRLGETDLKLLRVVQEGAREPIRTLAERIALSHNGTLNRFNRLEDSRAILRYMADIDEDIFGNWPFYWVQVALTQSGRANLGRLEAAISAAPEITQAAELVGVFDLMLRVALQKPADWTPLQAQLDPSAELIQTAHLHPIGRLIKQVTPHPLFIQVAEP
jgi:DNA-binding Lrp family transcriptional regulator